MKSIERIFFQIEQAHWYYEDFIRERNPALPSFSLKKFSAKFFQHCPLLHEWSNEHETAFANFMDYKVRVPVCGAIVLNETMDKVRNDIFRGPYRCTAKSRIITRIMMLTHLPCVSVTSAFWSKDGSLNHVGASPKERSTRMSRIRYAPFVRYLGHFQRSFQTDVAYADK